MNCLMLFLFIVRKYRLEELQEKSRLAVIKFTIKEQIRLHSEKGVHFHW